MSGSGGKLSGKQSALHAGSGAVVGLVEVCTMLPLDLVKTRLQMQVTKPGDPEYYNGIIDCFHKMYKKEGFFALWKGFVPATFIKMPKMAIKFTAFEKYKSYYVYETTHSNTMANILAGVSVGATEAVLFNPVEVVKVTLQTNKARVEEVPSAWVVTRKISKEYGFGPRGFYKGLTATICSNMCFNSVYFGFYYTVKEFVPDVDDPVERFVRTLTLGFASSSLACMFNIPFDVAKTRIQGPQPIIGRVKYRRTMATMFMVYREEGLMALYKGLGPKMIRIGPGGAVLLLVYDYVHISLLASFED